MEELIQIKTSEGGKKIVSAKELYDTMDLKKAHWARWSRMNIENNKFAIEKEDYISLTMMVNGAETVDYAITLEFAKKLAMTVKNERGEKVRQYFIECEKKLRGEIQLPRTYAEALLEAGRLALEVEKQQAQIESLKPKAEFFDAVTDSKDAIDIGNVAKILNLGIGRNQMFEFLRSRNVLMRNNVPYQRYIDCGYFRIIEQKYQKADGSTHINIKTLVFQKGMDFILKIYNQKV